MGAVDRRPWRNPAPRLGLAVLFAAFGLAACTAGGGGGSGEAEGLPAPADGGATSSSISPAALSPTADDVNKLLSSEDGVLDPQQVEILAVDETGPGVLLVSFEMASHHCYGVHVAVTETGGAVTLDLHTGRRAGVSPAACPFGVFPYTTQVTLAAPLGEREVVTGAGSTKETSTGETSPAAGTATTSPPAGSAPSAAALDPAQVDPAMIPADGIDRYVGRHVEDGVEWALANGRAWRIVSEDRISLADGSSDPARLSFTVVADVIVGYEWS